MDHSSEHLLLQALRREPHTGVPVWFMRQAGRYLPGYREVRSRVDFLTLCKTPELAAEVTVEPLERFGVDAVIIFSDILVPLEAMGLPVTFTDGGPCMERPLQNRRDIDALRPLIPEEGTPYVMQVIKEVQRRVEDRVPVIGFAGAPFTLACYALEGSPSRTFQSTLRLVYEDPAALHALLGKLADAIGVYLRAQVRAGAQVVQLFDTWGGLLSHDTFEEFSLAYCRRILSQLDGLDVPRILFIKGAGEHLAKIARSGAEAVGFDHTVDPKRAQRLVAERAALQGNLAPAALFAPEADLRARTRAILENFIGEPGYVFNLGHGILPGTPPEHVDAVVDEVHSYRKER